MTEFNGHRSWNAWNVSLWISSEEHLYREACAALRNNYTYQMATDSFCHATGLVGGKTPDGAVYNYRCLYEALVGLEIPLKEHR